MTKHPQPPIRVKFSDIVWETDDSTEDMVFAMDLPESVVLDVPDDVDLNNEAASILSDKYGWLVKSLNYSRIEKFIPV